MELKFSQEDIGSLTDQIANKVFERFKEVPTMRLLTIDELAECLNVPKSWIYERTRNRTGDGIPRVYLGKYIRFHLPDVIQWLKDHDHNQ